MVSDEVSDLETFKFSIPVAKLEQTDVVFGHVVNQVTGRVDLTQRQLVVVLENNQYFKKKARIVFRFFFSSLKVRSVLKQVLGQESVQ